MSAVIRPARPDDCELIAILIGELAEYERLAHEAVATADDLRRDLFGERPYAEAVIAEVEGEPAGFALFFHNYSTFQGRPGLYLEDLFVRPAYRGRGLGRALLVHLARLALARGCGRMEWAVLDWNAPAIAFYESLGARPMSDWTTYRLDGAALGRLGTVAASGPG
jgi:GNAT superfamily N-acetyltransferase